MLLCEDQCSGWYGFLGKYAAVIKLRPKGMSQQHCTVGMIGHVMNQQTIVLKK